MPRKSNLTKQLEASLRLIPAQDRGTAVVAQVGGTHYSRCAGHCPHCGGEVQHWDLMARAPYLEAQICRYINRWMEKGGREDLAKARSFLDKLEAVLNLQESTAAERLAAPPGR